MVSGSSTWCQAARYGIRLPDTFINNQRTEYSAGKKNLYLKQNVCPSIDSLRLDSKATSQSFYYIWDREVHPDLHSQTSKDTLLHSTRLLMVKFCLQYNSIRMRNATLHLLSCYPIFITQFSCIVCGLARNLIRNSI